VAIMGPSGSGQSTLMNLIGCLDRPTSGSYRLDGEDVSTLDDDALAAIRLKKLGFVFQGFDLIPSLSALENVALPAQYAGLRVPAAQARANALLEQVGLAKRAHHLPGELSGGEQQRVAIARALVNDPWIVLADEPTGELDTKTAEQIMRLLQRFNQERGVTVIIVTHNVEHARRCDPVITLQDGRILR